jgi:rRNA maturation protein Nop10
MNERKFCRKCGASNTLKAVFCAHCGETFSAQSPSHISPQEPPYLEDVILNKIRGFFLPVTGKKILVGGVVLVLLIVAAGAMASASNSPGVTSSVTPTPVPTVAPTAEATVKATPTAEATVKATPTPEPTSAPTATPAPTAAPTAAPSGGSAVARMPPAELSLFDSIMTDKDYTVVTPLAYKEDTVDHFPMYQGMMTKDGYVFSFTLIQTDSPSHAQAVFQNSVTVCKGLGYSGDTQGDGSWYGTKTSDTGTPQAALVMPPGSDNTVITLLGE